jgi:hypothetical protein
MKAFYQKIIRESSEARLPASNAKMPHALKFAL